MADASHKIRIDDLWIETSGIVEIINSPSSNFPDGKIRFVEIMYESGRDVFFHCDESQFIDILRDIDTFGLLRWQWKRTGPQQTFLWRKHLEVQEDLLKRIQNLPRVQKIKKFQP